METAVPQYSHRLSSLVTTFLGEYSPTAEFNTGSIDDYLSSRRRTGLTSAGILQELVTQNMLFVLSKIYEHNHPVLNEWGVAPEDDRPIRIALWECAQRSRIYNQVRIERAKMGLPIDGDLSVFKGRVGILSGFCNKLLERPSPSDPVMRK